MSSNLIDRFSEIFTEISFVIKNQAAVIYTRYPLFITALISSFITMILILVLLTPEVKKDSLKSQSEKKAIYESKQDSPALTPTIKLKKTIKDKKEIKPLKKAQSLLSHLIKRGVEKKIVYKIIHASKGLIDTRKLKIGTEITLIYQGQSNQIKSIVIRKDFENDLCIDISQEKIKASIIPLKIYAEEIFKKGIIINSLYEDAGHIGIPAKVIHQFSDLYSYDIDFQRDLRENSKFSITYTRYTSENYGDINYGDIGFAKLDLKNKSYYMYQYTNSKGQTDFYDEKGHSIRKSLLKTPIDSARISSRFGMRKHPILGYSKPHRGIDFAAKRGTPIKASGAGIIERANWYGSYGRYIRIRHKNGYQSAYAHLDKFARGIKKGKWVKQGQIIGYVGTTGRSTGPHLHYEVIKDGKKINPSSIKMPPKIILNNEEMQIFNKHIEKYASNNNNK